MRLRVACLPSRWYLRISLQGQESYCRMQSRLEVPARGASAGGQGVRPSPAAGMQRAQTTPLPQPASRLT